MPRVSRIENIEVSQALPCQGGLRSVPVVDERIRELLKYWQKVRSNRPAPDRREFDPTCVASVLRYFWVLQRDREARAYRFTLAGEETLNLLGRKLVGASLDEVFGEQAGQFAAAADVVLEKPAVLHMVGPMYRTDRAAVYAERLALPMRDGDRMDRIYGATIYHSPTSAQVHGARFAGDVDATVVPVAELGTGT